MQHENPTTVIALDIGAARTGVAMANSIARIASPLEAIVPVDDVPERVRELVLEHGVVAVVAGLPRNLEGNETGQTAFVRDVIAQIESVIDVPVHTIDEAVTSARAEAELQLRRKTFTKEDIDMLSATYILEDYLQTNPEVFSRV